MVTYKESDVQFSWDNPEHPHQPCAYVKEEAGLIFLFSLYLHT